MSWLSLSSPIWVGQCLDWIVPPLGLDRDLNNWNPPYPNIILIFVSIHIINITKNTIVYVPLEDDWIKRKSPVFWKIYFICFTAWFNVATTSNISLEDIKWLDLWDIAFKKPFSRPSMKNTPKQGIMFEQIVVGPGLKLQKNWKVLCT